MRLTRALCALACAVAPALASAELAIPIHLIRQQVEQPPTLSNLDRIPEDNGLRGAELAIIDNNTTGRFLGQSYELVVHDVPVGGDLLAEARAALAESHLIVLDAPMAEILSITDLPEAAGALFINGTNESPELRDDQCRRNLLHTAPSMLMRTDALMQFLLQKRWTRLALVAGTNERDQSFAVALTRSARKFGMKIAASKVWAFDADMRRNASAEVPLFTQEFGDYDVLLLADEIGDFGRYVMYNTWLPRPIAGSEGIRPATWAPVVEQWGAAQLQSRFLDLAGRDMRPEDYGTWAAVRSIGEAVTRTNSDDPETLRSFMLSDQFELAGFKGVPMTFRDWNGQMRQPIPLVHPNAVVAQAPLEGFLHQRTELDTLGLDTPESQCTAFKE